MVVRAKDLWSLVQNHQWVDPEDLRAAVEDQVTRRDLDYRSRLLIRDSLKALRHHWGDERIEGWLSGSPLGREIETICRGPWDDDRGFSSLMRRVVDVIKPETIQEYFRQLSRHVRRPLRLAVGGSAALILPGYLSRPTEDIDVVDEVPKELREQHALLDDLKARYGLELAHFQQHYLPMRWQDRLHYLDTFGELTVYLVDVYDVFLSKLFSIRTKDIDDLRALKPHLDKDTLARRLHDTCGSMLVAESLRQRAVDNWYILYGEALPS
jgi:Nucleotidyltransferase of unknown function (DUF6036)